MIETHKYEDSIGVRFPVLNHLLILFGRHFQVHGENVAGAISKIRYAVWRLVLRRLEWVLGYVLVDTYSGGRSR